MFRLGARVVGPGEPVCVVAELGVNHNGDPRLAWRLIEAAREAGADAVKLQLFAPEELASPGAALCAYQADAGAADQLAMLRTLALQPGQVRKLAQAASARGILLWASVFDAPSLAQAVALGFPAIKLGSGELTCLPLHEEVCRARLPTVCSTGMAMLEEIRPVVALYRAHAIPLLLLHCVSAYPAPEDELDLRAMAQIRDEFGCPVGFSDHTAGTFAAPLAVSLGAVLIEKHFTLDCALSGPDHKASLEPAAFAAFVREIRRAEAALGTGRKNVAPSEREVRLKARKSLFLRHARAAGHRLTPEDIACRRPGTGISPMELARVLGKTVARDLNAGEALRWEDLAP